MLSAGAAKMKLLGSAVLLFAGAAMMMSSDNILSMSGFGGTQRRLQGATDDQDIGIDDGRHQLGASQYRPDGHGLCHELIKLGIEQSQRCVHVPRIADQPSQVCLQSERPALGCIVGEKDERGWIAGVDLKRRSR